MVKSETKPMTNYLKNATFTPVSNRIFLNYLFKELKDKLDALELQSTLEFYHFHFAFIIIFIYNIQFLFINTCLFYLSGVSISHATIRNLIMQ